MPGVGEFTIHAHRSMKQSSAANPAPTDRFSIDTCRPQQQVVRRDFGQCRRPTLGELRPLYMDHRTLARLSLMNGSLSGLVRQSPTRHRDFPTAAIAFNLDSSVGVFFEVTRTSTGAAFRAISETAPQFLLGAPYAGQYGTCDSHLALSLDRQQRNLG